MGYVIVRLPLIQTLNTIIPRRMCSIIESMTMHNRHRFQIPSQAYTENKTYKIVGNKIYAACAAGPHLCRRDHHLSLCIRTPRQAGRQQVAQQRAAQTGLRGGQLTQHHEGQLAHAGAGIAAALQQRR